MTDTRRRNLLILLAVLAALRFGVLPWIELQNTTKQELEVVTRRLDRSVGVVENRDAINTAAKQSTVALDLYRARFEQGESLEAYKLTSQQRISALIASTGTRLTVFDWVIERVTENPFVDMARAKIQLTGSIQALAAAQGRLESELTFVALREVRVDPQFSSAAPATTNASMTIVVDVYFRKKGSAP